MKPILFAAVLTLFAAPAWAAKDCAELKSEIDAKIQSHGVAKYTLEIVDTAAEAESKVVGSCAGGQKKIVYRRG
ncbi:DUF1161 domain-containing protein [Solimonas variicoloris]|uniref:DUF1161 domain-containing protein n=1 Tax=Solimonas variicoloris TaxID=254408 RepID=UPI0003999782|nr:DUF1161 domain-containing protein [Solimonas variicoloris]